MKDAPAYPPRLVLRFFRWYCHPKLVDHIEGDLLELYTERLRKGKLRADMLFIVDVLLLFRRGIIKPAEGYQQANAYSMYKSYWKIGWRNLWNNKTYSLINIGGLGVGLTVAMLIGLWVVDELHYNRSFDNYDRITTVYHNLTFDGRIFSINTAPYPLGAELKNNFAELESVVEATEPTDHVVGISGKRLSGKTMFVDPEFASVFSLQILEGSANGLGSLRSVMLSKSLASSLLGENAVGTTVKLDNRDELLVTAVFEDLPTNSALSEVRMLVPMDYFFTLPEHREQKTLWGGFDFQCFVMLKRGQSFGPLESKIGRFLADRSTEQAKTLKPEGILFPMSRWHLYADFKDGKNIGGKIKYVWMFGTVGIFVLLLACINFMNLSTARSERRSKEVGVRKVMGSMRSQLVQQFLSESFLVVTAGFMLAVVVVSMSLPLFNAMTDKQISIPWNNGYFLLTASSFIVITSLLAGSYPAVYLSAFNPVRVLKGALTPNRQASLPRQVLVVFQFTVSIALIITTIIVFQQLQYAKKRPAGFDREAIIYVEMKSKELRAANYNLLRNDLVATRVVTNMGTSNFPITGGMGAEAAITWEGKDPSVQPIIAMNSCSFDYPQTSGFEFLQGRDFSPEFRTDSAAMIVNEEAAKLFAGNDHRVLGKKVTWDSKEHEIIGVIKDQIRWSPFSRQSAHVYFVDYRAARFLTIRMNPSVDVQQALLQIEGVLKKYDPETPFDYTFVDDDYARQFKDEERIGELASLFSGLAIFISCIGIFGLATFAASQRTKEIGIRKVMGASVFALWKMLSRDFVWLVLIAVCIATPLAYYFSSEWLQQYEYRIGISWYVFAIAGAGALLITLATVSFQSIRAALANPVNSLRSE